MVEKIKNLFVVTLDDGRQTYFDFADGNIYGYRVKIDSEMVNISWLDAE